MIGSRNISHDVLKDEEIFIENINTVIDVNWGASQKYFGNLPYFLLAYVYTWYHQFLLFYVHMYILSVPSFCLSNVLKFLDAIASLECGYESEWVSQSVWFRQIMIILQNIACIHIEYRYIECSLNTHWIIAKHGAIHI